MKVNIKSLEMHGHTLIDTIMEQDGTVAFVVVENTQTQEWNRKPAHNHRGSPYPSTAHRNMPFCSIPASACFPQQQTLPTT